MIEDQSRRKRLLDQENHRARKATGQEEETKVWPETDDMTHLSLMYDLPVGLSQTPQCIEYLISWLIYLYFNCPRSTDVCQREKAACVSVVRLLHDYHIFR